MGCGGHGAGLLLLALGWALGPHPAAAAPESCEADDEAALMQLQPRRLSAGTAPDGDPICPGNFSVCPTDETQQRCGWLEGFTIGGGFLFQGITGVGGCTRGWQEPLNESCFEDPPSGSLGELLLQYARGYSEWGGTHTAWMWSGKSFAKQDSWGLIGDYYWKFVARYAKGFRFTAYPEPLNAPFAQEHKTCAVVPSAEGPGYLLFGFTSEPYVYGAGFAIIDEHGFIVRQLATGDGPVADESTPGSVVPAPTSIGGDGPAAAMVKSYWDALAAGDIATVAAMYHPKAKVILYNSLNASNGDQVQLQGFEGPGIAAYLNKVVSYFGPGAIANGTLALRFGEEKSQVRMEKVPGNAYSAYEIGSAKYTQAFVLGDGGKIWGEGVVAAMPGFVLR
uniref:SnoaL-like domain-containing protein n=1 Tax=Zooxanthella nutricula TaxID=1333877 RepID=A0A7S2LPV8_9DINO